MREIFNESLDLNGKITDMMGHCDIISIEVNSTMSVLDKHEGKVSDKFLAARYLELVDDLVKYGIVERKDW